MRWVVLALFFACGCVATTSHTRTGTGLFAPKEQDTSKEEDEVPRGLSLALNSIAPDGTVTLDLRNYSMETFTFAGAPDKPQLLFEVQQGNAHSRHKVTQWTRTKTHELPAGERMQVKTNVGGLSGRVRIGMRSHDFGYTVWTDWFPL